MDQAGSKRFKTDLTISDEVKDLGRKILDNSFTQNEINYIAECLGKFSRHQFIEMIEIYTAKKEKIGDQLEEYSSYNSEWNKGVVNTYAAYVNGVTNYRQHNETKIITCERLLFKSAENICSVLNERFVSIFGLSEALLLYSFSGSKNAVNLLSRISSSGSYSNLQNVITEMGRNPPALPEGDVVLTFDNQQVIGRGYTMKLGANQRTSVVTSLSAFVRQQNTNDQYSKLTNPTYLQYPIPLNQQDHFSQLYANFTKLADNIVNSHQIQWINLRLRVLETEYSHEMGDLNNEQIKELIMDKRYENGIEYERIEQNKVTFSVTDLKNILINPNSRQTCEEVLNEIKKLVDSSEREWISIVCDGAPYNICFNLIQNCLECTSCSSSGEALVMRDHQCDNGNAGTIQRKYRKLVLKPGAGHIELNIVRSLLKIYFDIFLQPIADILGYKTDRAQGYLRKGIDHHKSMQILRIVFLALSDEILYLYLHQCKRAGAEATAAGFSDWRLHQSNQLLIAIDFVFSFLHPLFLFRAGIRQGNDEVSLAALHKASSCMYGFNHPNYQKLLARDILYVISLTDPKSNLLKKNSGCVNSSSLCEGFDFLLEWRNKLQKLWLVCHGIPTDHQWIKSSCSLSLFEKIKIGVLKRCQLDLPLTEKRETNFGKEYIEARKHFRKYLSNDTSSTETFTVNENPTKLANTFINCPFTCKENQEKYFSLFIKGVEPKLQMMDIFGFESMSLKELKKVLQSKTKQLNSQRQKHYKELIKSEEIKENLEMLAEEIANEVDEYLEEIA